MTSILPTYVVTENYFHLYFRCFVREMFQGGLIWIKAVIVLELERMYGILIKPSTMGCFFMKALHIYFKCHRSLFSDIIVSLILGFCQGVLLSFFVLCSLLYTFIWFLYTISCTFFLLLAQWFTVWMDGWNDRHTDGWMMDGWNDRQTGRIAWAKCTENAYS